MDSYRQKFSTLNEIRSVHTIKVLIEYHNLLQKHARESLDCSHDKIWIYHSGTHYNESLEHFTICINAGPRQDAWRLSWNPSDNTSWLFTPVDVDENDEIPTASLDTSRYIWSRTYTSKYMIRASSIKNAVNYFIRRLYKKTLKWSAAQQDVSYKKHVKKFTDIILAIIGTLKIYPALILIEDEHRIEIYGSESKLSLNTSTMATLPIVTPIVMSDQKNTAYVEDELTMLQHFFYNL